MSFPPRVKEVYRLEEMEKIFVRYVTSRNERLQGPWRSSVTSAEEWEGCADQCFRSPGERAVRDFSAGGCCFWDAADSDHHPAEFCCCRCGQCALQKESHWCLSLCAEGSVAFQCLDRLRVHTWNGNPFIATLDLLSDLDSSGWFLWPCRRGKRLNYPGCEYFVLSCAVLSVLLGHSGEGVQMAHCVQEAGKGRNREPLSLPSLNI